MKNNNEELFDDTLSKKHKKKTIKKEIFSWLSLIVIAFAIAFFINNVIIVNATVPTGSMRNTIQENSRIVAFRLAYLFSEPSRNDVIAFRFPDDPSILYIKRIIGLPGERIEIINGQVFINHSSVPLYEDYLFEPPVGHNMIFYVPPYSYFVLGDDRNNSHDSRFWANSFVFYSDILGRALFSYFPRIGLIR